MENKGYKEMVIQNIIDCGQSIIDNAEKIANDYTYSLGDLYITCTDICSRENFPKIEVVQSFLPEGVTKRNWI